MEAVEMRHCGNMEPVEKGNRVDRMKDRFENFRGVDFRPGQREAIRFAMESGKKAVVICAPTGSGKSLIGMATGAAYERFCYLSSSKQLQRQLTVDFPEARFMMGRGNFECNQDPQHRTADLCIHSSNTPCELKGICNYEVQKQAVLAHPYQVLNYHYFLTEANYVGKFAGYPLIICDEVDVLEGMLTGFIELRLSKTSLDSLNLNPPRYRTSTAKSGLTSWRQWAEKQGKEKIKARVNLLEAYLSSLRPGMPFTAGQCRLVREYKALEGLNAKLSMFGRHVDKSWIFQERKTNEIVDGWVFQPTWLTPELSHEYLFRHGERFLLMSATIPPKPVLAEMLGLNTGDIDYIEIPSTFPTANRPVLLNPVADLSYKTFDEELPKLLAAIEQTINRHKGEKGIIHTTSWKLNQAIMGLNHTRLMSHNGYDKDQALETFVQSQDKVFVSPSSIRGVDLPDDLCRFSILPKAPYANLSDRLVSARMHSSGLGMFWYRAICAQDLVQASGRGVRHKEDYCITYLLDKQIEKLVVDNQNLFPRYWMDAVDYA